MVFQSCKAYTDEFSLARIVIHRYECDAYDFILIYLHEKSLEME